MADPEARGYIYFIASDAQKAIKVGFATDVYTRFRSLQTGNPDELRVIGSAPAFLGAEMYFHKAMKKQAVRLEWYPKNDFFEALVDELQDQVLDGAIDLLQQQGCEPAGSFEAAAAYLRQLESYFPLTAADVERAITTIEEEFAYADPITGETNA